MDACEFTGLSQFGQIPSDCLWSHTKMFDKPINSYFTFAASDRNDLWFS